MGSIIVIYYIDMGPDWLRAGLCRGRIPVGVRFFAHVQSGPGAQPYSCTMGSGSFSGVKRPGRGADHRGQESVDLYPSSGFLSLLGVPLLYCIRTYRHNQSAVMSGCYKQVKVLYVLDALTGSFMFMQLLVVYFYHKTDAQFVTTHPENDAIKSQRTM
jgi:hypothetical protein